MTTQNNRAYKYYSILEVSRDSTYEEIRKAYRNLAKKYHPDVNSNPEALEKFKKINAAFEVLGDPIVRASYDASLYECPSCWTHEIIYTSNNFYRCRKCGCKFNTKNPTKILEIVKPEAVATEWSLSFSVFQATQCSWCALFYTNEPFLCPHKTLRSNCISFERISSVERNLKLNDTKWKFRIYDSINEANKQKQIHKCRECGAINLYMKSLTCWQCGKDSLRCTSCTMAPLLTYDCYTKIWQCTNNACRKKFAIVPKSNKSKTDLDLCPVCHQEIKFDFDKLLWICPNPSCKQKGEKKQSANGQDKEPKKKNTVEQPINYSAKEPEDKNTTKRPASYRAKRKSSDKYIITILVILIIIIIFLLLYGLGVFYPFI